MGLTMKFAKKLTIKELTGGKAILRKEVAALADDGATMDVGTIYGKVTAAKRGRNIMPDESVSEYVRFIGQFRGIGVVGPDAGATYASSQLILPEIASQVLEGGLGAIGITIAPLRSNAASDDDDGASGDANQGASLEFALKMTARRDDDSAVGYTFGCEPLIEPKEDEGLRRLALLASPKGSAPTATEEASVAPDGDDKGTTAKGGRAKQAAK